jgi:hypothetical protein
MSTIVAPVQDFSGTVAGVQFKDGKAETDDAAAIAYFRRKGYEVDGDRREMPTPPEPPDPRFITTQHSGGLRDAAADPRPGDFRTHWPVGRGRGGRPVEKPPVPVVEDDAGHVVAVGDA